MSTKTKVTLIGSIVELVSDWETGSGSGESGNNQAQGEENREPLPNPWSQPPASSQSSSGSTASQPLPSTAGLGGV